MHASSNENGLNNLYGLVNEAHLYGTIADQPLLMQPKTNANWRTSTGNGACRQLDSAAKLWANLGSRLCTIARWLHNNNYRPVIRVSICLCCILGDNKTCRAQRPTIRPSTSLVEMLAYLCPLLHTAQREDENCRRISVFFVVVVSSVTCRYNLNKSAIQPT